MEAIPENEYKKLSYRIERDIAILQPPHLLPYLFDRKNKPHFAKHLDETLLDIAANNNKMFSVTIKD